MVVAVRLKLTEFQEETKSIPLGQKRKGKINNEKNFQPDFPPTAKKSKQHERVATEILGTINSQPQAQANDNQANALK